MARVKFVVPADFDADEYTKRAIKLQGEKKYSEAIALLEIIEKVEAVSVPAVLDPDTFDWTDVLPADPDAFLRKKDGGEKSSGGVKDFMITTLGEDGETVTGYFVVSVTMSRVTEEQRKDWQLK